MQALEATTCNLGGDRASSSSSDPPITNTIINIQVVVLEEFLQGPFCVSHDEEESTIHNKDGMLLPAAFSRWIGLVNRVSDAAEPWEVKACMAILQLAKQVWNIPIWNGPDAYSLCTHKWCHHVLFKRARLKSPPTVVSMAQAQSAPGCDSGNNDQERKAVGMLHRIQQQGYPDRTRHTVDYLVKPNAGGFGAGIEQRQARLHTTQQNATKTTTTTTTTTSPLEFEVHGLPTYSDRVVLFQNYIQPKNSKIYRVWFLRGKVQCAVERSVDEQQQSTEEFTSGCVGGRVCQRRPKEENTSATAISITSSPPPHLQPWTVPEDVRREIEDQLAPVLPKDAHCGSVEFLYTSTKEKNAKQRLYFDLNLLSTLPVEDNPEKGASAADPWLQLASAILLFIY